MTMEERAEGGDSPRDKEESGLSSDVPAAGMMDSGAGEPLGNSKGMRHWRESTITKPGLSDRGNVFFAAIEMTRMPMVLTDPNLPDNPIVFVNKAFLDLTLYEEEEVLGRNCRFLQGAQTDGEHVAQVRRALENKDSIAIEILNYKRDGTPFWNALFIGPVYDTSGNLLHFFASQLDVTRRREAELSSHQAQKMEAIGQLTAGMAHDFNNLLQVVNGNLELLAARTQDEVSSRYLKRARSAAERGAQLTGQLLAFARKTRLTPKPVDVSACISGFVDMIESSVGSKVEIHLSLRRGLPRALLDSQQFEMAILNIALNARDAMPEGGLITISTGKAHLNGDAGSQGLQPGDYIVVEIRDEGVGMPPPVAKRAVEPFFTTKATGKGTGLGLAMASGFVQQSRGRLEVESKEGAGTTVRMLFPVASADLTEVQEPAQFSAPAASQSGHSAHVLVVEDSSEVLMLARENLEEAGYRVTTAPSGEEGLDSFKRALEGDKVDLLFTDLVMPGSMNGITLAQEVAKLDAAVAILMTTGYNEELVIDGSHPAGGDVLGKPYRRNELLDRVARALDQRGVVTQRRRASDFGAAEE
jgi:PAS domain S-box-containing protein